MAKIKKRPLPTDLTATIESLSHEGRGIASIEGKKAFIHNALPGETVKFNVVRNHRRYFDGVATEVFSPSPTRAPIKCTFYDACGGCQLQHMENNEQVKLKQNTLLEHLKHFGNLSPKHILPPLSGNPYGYRRQARLGVRYVTKKDKLLIGFRERNGRYIAEMNRCEILDPRLGHKLDLLQNTLASLEMYQEIAQIEVAIGDNGAALIVRHLAQLPQSDIDTLIGFGQEHDFWMYSQSGGPDTVKPFSSVPMLHYRLEHFDLTYEFEPGDFVQVNAEMNQSLVLLAIKLLDPQPNETILDLFCGLGNFSLPIAKHCKTLVGVEGDARMTKRASQNANLNNLKNCRFYPADLTQPFDAMEWAKESFDKILIDPPRSGALEIVEKLAFFHAKRIVYVSCNPATLARDAEVLVHQQGYRLESIGVINMFPHTGHVESIALFEKE